MVIDAARAASKAKDWKKARMFNATVPLNGRTKLPVGLGTYCVAISEAKRAHMPFGDDAEVHALAVLLVSRFLLKGGTGNSSPAS